jgi:hypothetical protein
MIPKLLLEEIMGKLSWLGLEPMHTVTKLTIFMGLSPQDKNLCLYQIVSMMSHLGETGWITLLSQSQCFSGEGSSGEISWPGLEPMHAAAK